MRAYIDDLLIISNGNFEDHLNKVKIVLKKLEKNCKLVYFGLKIIRQGIIPLPDKVQAIQNVAVPSNKKQLS